MSKQQQKQVGMYNNGGRANAAYYLTPEFQQYFMNSVDNSYGYDWRLISQGVVRASTGSFCASLFCDWLAPVNASFDIRFDARGFIIIVDTTPPTSKDSCCEMQRVQQEATRFHSRAHAAMAQWRQTRMGPPAPPPYVGSPQQQGNMERTRVRKLDYWNNSEFQRQFQIAMRQNARFYENTVNLHTGSCVGNNCCPLCFPEYDYLVVLQIDGSAFLHDQTFFLVDPGCLVASDRQAHLNTKNLQLQQFMQVCRG